MSHLPLRTGTTILSLKLAEVTVTVLIRLKPKSVDARSEMIVGPKECYDAPESEADSVALDRDRRESLRRCRTGQLRLEQAKSAPIDMCGGRFGKRALHSGVVLLPGVSLELSAVEVDFAQVSGGVAPGLIVEVR